MIRPWRGRPSDLNPPLVGLAPEAGTSAELGCCLSAAICLFLASLSGRPELVLPVSGTANLLILTSHYDGPTQPNGPRRGGNREAPDHTTASAFLCAMAPEPVVDFETKWPRADENSEPLYVIQLLAMGEDSGDLIRVKV